MPSNIGSRYILMNEKLSLKRRKERKKESFPFEWVFTKHVGKKVEKTLFARWNVVGKRLALPWRTTSFTINANKRLVMERIPQLGTDSISLPASLSSFFSFSRTNPCQVVFVSRYSSHVQPIHYFVSAPDGQSIAKTRIFDCSLTIFWYAWMYRFFHANDPLIRNVERKIFPRLIASSVFEPTEIYGRRGARATWMPTRARYRFKRLAQPFARPICGSGVNVEFRHCVIILYIHMYEPMIRFLRSSLFQFPYFARCNLFRCVFHPFSPPLLREIVRSA